MYVIFVNFHGLISLCNNHFFVGNISRRDIILFDGIKFEIENVTGDDFQEQFNLCLTNKDHYDVIHRKEYILMAGICQCKYFSFDISIKRFHILI